MRKLIYCIVLSVGMLGANTSAYADPHRLCTSVMNVAESVLLIRHNGTSERSVRQFIMSEIDTPQLERVVHIIINQAYARPRIYSEPEKERAAMIFAQDKYNECMIALGSTS